MIPKSNCIECKKILWDDLPSFQPKKGNLAICVFCGCIMEFDHKLILVQASYKTQIAKENSTLIKLLNRFRANPFNGDEDKFNIRNTMFNMQ